jgi:HD superfamily phosphodiesterase
MNIKNIITTVKNNLITSVNTEDNKIISEEDNKNYDLPSNEALSNYNKGLINTKESLTQNNTDNKQNYIKKYIKLIKEIKKNENISQKYKEIIIPKINKINIDLATQLCNDEDFPKNEISYILIKTNEENIQLATQLCNDKNFPKNEIFNILQHTNKKNIDLATNLCNDKDFPKNKIINILLKTNKNNIELVTKLCTDKELNFPQNEIENVLQYINKDNLKQAENLINNWENGELPANSISLILNKDNKISYSDIKKLQHTIGKNNVDKFNRNDLKISVKLFALAKKQNINEIPLSEKRNTVRNLISYNADLFEISSELKKQFPLIPTNQEEYCALLPALVKSLGIETNSLTQDENNKLDVALNDLSTSLEKISDSDFNEMTINQEYPKSDFINDTFNIVKDLPSSERQKVYDYFGFELHKNKNGNSVDNSKYNFSIVGYPVNLNNGKKLAQIDDEQTKQVVEKLRPYVIQFSENNKITCNDKNIEANLNEVVKAFPEIRCEIDKLQHSTQDFDVMKHSLKVMQKITQNPEFNKLNESDKKILLLSSLFHDINKSEGTRDSAHADESAFDTFYISNKLNLTRDEKVKLYSLCKSHEWLNYVNNDKLTPDEYEKRLQSVAFDLQYDNLFEMAKIFTEGDLKSVKNDNSFFDKHCNALKTNSQKIDNYINELKKSQPLLPVTKLPTASRIEEAITQVNEDGSTNIKGVYKDKSGVVVLKYNEIEDWEKIGFPSGSSSKGINAKAHSGRFSIKKDVETGNIKFFAHGLDFENQLSKFDAFALPDSDALLSVSYAERPESKYRFFRTQGVLLDVDTKYIFGGGNTDKGSGKEKDVQKFKDNYIFGGKREEDRLYISNLIKENLNLSDDEYVKFVNENKNKALIEIEPEEIRTKLIQAFATINSNIRKGEREYNEMYVTNPRVMGVFAYSPEGKIGDINNFMNSQEGFLKQYAKDNNLPFVIFGD